MISFIIFGAIFGGVMGIILYLFFGANHSNQ